MPTNPPFPSGDPAPAPEAPNSPDLFQEFFEVLPEPVILVDATGRIALANPPAEELFGYPPGHLKGHDVEDLVPPSTRESHPNLRARFSESPHFRPSGSGLQLRGVRRDGREFPADISLRPLKLQGGAFVLCVIRDVTERARIHGELLAAHDELDVRVRQRTRELEEANRALQREVAERRKAEQRLLAQHAVARALAESTGLGEAMDKMLQALCLTMDCEQGELWRFEGESSRLLPIRTWSRGTPPPADDRPAPQPLRIPASTELADLATRSWQSGRPEWMLARPTAAPAPASPAATSAASPAAPAASPAPRPDDLLSAFAFPLRESGEVHGVMLFVGVRMPEPDAEDLGMFVALDHQFGQFVERLRTQESLRRSEERYRRLADNSPDMIYRYQLEPERRFDYVNPAATHITGFTPEEYYGDPDLVRRCTLESDLPALTAIIDNPPRNWAQATVRWRRKDGMLIWTEHRIVPVFNAAGDFVEIKGIVRDVTEHKLSQDALQQQVTYATLINRITRTMASNQNLQQVLHVVPEYLETHLGTDSASLYIIDEQGALKPVARGPRGRELAARIRLGEDAVPVEHMGLEACLRGESHYMPDLLAVQAPVLKSLASAGIRSLMAVPLVAENEVLGILTVSRNQPDGITAAERDFLHTLADHVALAVYQAHLLSDLKHAYEELKTTQEQVIQTERLRALGQLASGIAHDINNSLSAVMLFATIGLRRPHLDAAMRHCLENVEKAATDATNTVSRLREFYRPRDPMEAFETVNVNEIVQDVLLLTRAKWKDEPQARGIPIDIVTEEGAGQVVQGHRSELREVLTNLVINSVDAMPRGGTITIRTRDLPDAVEVEVADTGIGMDESTRKRVFEPFFTTKGPQGTGLGMSVCWGVIQRHNGKIHVASEFGRGTAVTIDLPLGTSGRGARTQPDDIWGIRPLRILCADDEPLIREGLQTLLGHMGHRVVTAADGAEALRLFEKDDFDVVITDLGMPVLSGHDVARLVKERSPGTPVILLTGWGEWQDAARPAHVDLVSRKPPTQDSLVQALLTVTQP